MQRKISPFKQGRFKTILIFTFITLTVLALGQDRAPNPRYTAPKGEPLKGMRICIDPGHGGQIWGKTRGYTGGTRSVVSSQSESEANLRIALFLWDLLTQAGAEVVMTRTFETRLSEDCFAEPDSEEFKANRREELNIRVRVAEANKSDLFLSIHHNAGANVNFATAFFFESDGPGQNEIKHSPEAVELSKKLANAITQSLGNKLGIKTRAPRHGNYHVIRETLLPAVLVECAFMTNREQSEWMEDLAYSRHAAIAIFEGILEACAEKKPEQDKTAKEVQP